MRTKIRAGRAALALLILALAAGAFPETRKLATLDEIAAAGTASSLDYARARNAAATAAAAVPALIKAKSSTLSLAYSYSDSSAAAGSAAGSPGQDSAASSTSHSLTAAANLPLLDQLSLTGSVKADAATKSYKSADVGVTLNPLAHSDARTQAQINYQKALAAADEKGRAAGIQAVKAALAWMSQKRQLATLEKTTALKEEAYGAAKASNAVDASATTLDDLVAALKDWSDSRSALVKAQAAERKAETELYSALGSTRDQLSLSALDLETLAAALASLESSLAPAAGSGPAESYSAKAASLDAAGGSAKLAAIWAFEPDLAISAGYSIPSSGKATPSASIKLTLSLDDLKGEKKAEARADLDVALKSLALQKSADANAYDQALAAVQSAKLNSESRKLSRDQSAELAEVAALSYKSGSYSALENESALLALDAADDAYYQALADEYSAWLDLGVLAGK
jgi:hypothetical protein